VVSTCHGVKGEEFTTVIAFGLLQGYIPNWQSIIHGTGNKATEEASKLLYVICSRAKKHLHLIAEAGRLTGSRRPYLTTEVLAALNYNYDPAS
jgi:superfamily I DNA/RNA helicase